MWIRQGNRNAAKWWTGSALMATREHRNNLGELPGEIRGWFWLTTRAERSPWPWRGFVVPTVQTARFYRARKPRLLRAPDPNHRSEIPGAPHGGRCSVTSPRGRRLPGATGQQTRWPQVTASLGPHVGRCLGAREHCVD
jgi:hypothetical protein